MASRELYDEGIVSQARQAWTVRKGDRVTKVMPSMARLDSWKCANVGMPREANGWLP